jgi:hypothetical protein
VKTKLNVVKDRSNFKTFLQTYVHSDKNTGFAYRDRKVRLHVSQRQLVFLVTHVTCYIVNIFPSASISLMPIRLTIKIYLLNLQVKSLISPIRGQD